MRSDAGRVPVSWVVLLLLVLSTTISGAAKKKPAVKATTPPPVVTFDLTRMALPDTSPLPPALPPTLMPPKDPYVWDRFAWQSFIAMNWPAIEPSVENGFIRGWPNASDPDNVNFVCAGQHDGPLVWESFKEKREVFNHYAVTEEAAKPHPWSHPFDYPIDAADGYGKILTQGINFVALDETVEVASQAREEKTKVPDPASTPVFPRVYRGPLPAPLPAPGNEVRYEVKVNYDFFKYVVDNKFYFDENTYARSLKNPPVQLPWRTSSVSPGVKYYTQKPAKTNYVSGYSAEKLQTTYKKGPLKRGETPPEIGSVHIKAAWVPIQEGEKGNFLHRSSMYFVTDPQTGKVTVREALFGLAGLHIIQRIKSAPILALTGGNANPTPTLNSAPLGGTFIYATWEHVEIDPPDDRVPKQMYTYENLYRDGDETKTDGHGPYPVERLYRIIQHTKTANDSFWEQIKDIRCGPQKAKPVWLNYRLVGAQYLPVDIESDVDDESLKTIDQPDPGQTSQSGLPHYLANLYIETNKGLQHFQGLPPLTSPANQFATLGSPAFYAGNLAGTFDHTQKNLAYGGNLYTMGGCMGCHGVAQLKGYSFSFVLLGGQLGAGVDSESRFDPPPPEVPNRYLLSGGAVTILNTHKKQYLAFNGGHAVYQPAPDVFTIVGVSTDPGERLSFGDRVYLFERGTGQYLTATDHDETGDIRTVTFQNNNGVPAAVWILYDATDAGSTSEITSLGNLSFKNAAITFPDGNGAYLTTLPSNGVVNTTNHAGTNTANSLELWNLTRIR